MNKILPYKKITMFSALAAVFSAESILYEYIISMVINKLPIIVQLKFCFYMLFYLVINGLFLYKCDKTRKCRKSLDKIFYEKMCS